MKIILFFLALIAFNTYASEKVNPDTSPKVFIGEMTNAEKDSEGFYRAQLSGTEYICYNCTDDFGNQRLKGIWHRNLPDDDKSFNPHINSCSSYNLDWRIKGFFVDTYKREGFSTGSKYIAYYLGCLFYIDGEALSNVDDIEGAKMIKKLTLGDNFEPYVKGVIFDFLIKPFASEKAKVAPISYPPTANVNGEKLIKEMFSYVPSESGYVPIQFYTYKLKVRTSPYELYNTDLAKYYNCVKYGTSSLMNTPSNDIPNSCQLINSFKIVDNKIYLKDEKVVIDDDNGDLNFGGDSSGGGNSGGDSSEGGSTGGGSTGGGSSGGGSSGGGSSGGGSSGGGSSGGDSGGGGDGSVDGGSGGGNSGTGGGTGGGSGSDGDGSGGGNTDGDGDLLAEVKSFHRSFKDSLSVDSSLPTFDNSDLDFSELSEKNNSYIDNIEDSFNSSIPSFKSSFDGLKNKVPDMSLNFDEINKSFSGITGVCRPISFDVTLGLSDKTSLNKTIVLTDFCIWYDNNVRGFITWVFKIMTAVAVYFSYCCWRCG